MSNGLKVKNHYIPQMILKHFTNLLGKIYEFHISKKDWHLPNGNKTDGGMNTSGVGKENYLYIQEDEQGKLSDHMENNFAYLETEASPIIEKIINYKAKSFFNDIGPILDDNEYTILILFLAVGFLRTPNKLDEIAQGMSGVMLELFAEHLKTLDDPAITEEHKCVDYLNKNFVMEVCNQTLLYHTFQADMITEIMEDLNKYQWILVNNDTRFDFLMGDSFLNLERPGIRKKNTIFIPLGNKRGLLGSNENYLNISELNKGYINKKDKKESLIKLFNFHAIRNTKESVFSSIKSDSIKNYIVKNIHLSNTYIYSGASGKTYIPKYKRQNVKYKKK